MDKEMDEFEEHCRNLAQKLRAMLESAQSGFP